MLVVGTTVVDGLGWALVVAWLVARCWWLAAEAVLMGLLFESRAKLA